MDEGVDATSNWRTMAIDIATIGGSIAFGVLASMAVAWVGNPELPNDSVSSLEIFHHNALIAIVISLFGSYVARAVVGISGAGFGFAMGASAALRGWSETLSMALVYAPIEFAAWFFVLRAASKALSIICRHNDDWRADVRGFLRWECAAAVLLLCAAHIEAHVINSDGAHG